MNTRFSWSNHLFNFIAVILGVYLAFYMSERAAQHKEREESNVFMQSLITDLKEDLKTYQDYQIPVNQEQLGQINQLVEELANDKLDGLQSGMVAIFQVENYAASSSTYSSLKSSAKLGLIKDLDLQKELNNYYEGLATESQLKGQFQADYFTEELLDWSVRNVDLITMELVKTDELIVLRNHLIIYASLIDQKLENYKMIVEQSTALIESLEKALPEDE